MEKRFSQADYAKFTPKGQIEYFQLTKPKVTRKLRYRLIGSSDAKRKV